MTYPAPKIFLFILFCFCSLSCSESNTRSEEASTSSVKPVENAIAQEKTHLTPQEQKEDILQLIQLMDSDWAYKEEKALDTAALKKEFLQRVEQDLTPRAFFPVLQEIMARTKDGHSGIALPNYEQYSYVIPVYIEEVDGRFWVRKLLSTFSMQAAQLQVGDELLSIDGQSLPERIKERQKFIPASSQHDLKVKALREILGVTHKNNTVKVKRDGKVFNLTVAAESNNPFLWTNIFADLDASVINKDVFYVKIPSFLIYVDKGEQEIQRRSEEFTRVFNQASSYSNLILDLRDNWGGYVNTAAEISKYLLPAPFDYGHQRFRTLKAFKVLYGSGKITDTKDWAMLKPLKVEKDERIKPYSGQLFVLINGASFSSSDGLSAVLKDLHPNVTFVGEPTGAGSGVPQVLGELKHSKAVFTTSTSLMYSPHQRLIEGVGTQPDIPVQWTEKAIKTGQDPFVEAVLNKVKGL